MKIQAQKLMDFLDQSPVNFFAVSNVAGALDRAGYVSLEASAPWSITRGGRYYLTVNDSAIFAVQIPESWNPADGYRIIASHSDSPCFRVKPSPAITGPGGITRLNTEVYGGPILSTWFDRPLSLAGRAIVRDDNPLMPRRVLIKWDRPLLTIPNLAIHFNRAVNDGVKLSPQKDMLPVIGLLPDAKAANEALNKMVAEAAGCEVADLLDFDLMLYDTTPAEIVGIDGEFVTSGRLDDLEMVHASLEALLESDGTPCRHARVLAVFDNEETGSGTKQGAAAPVLPSMLRRITSLLGGSAEDYDRALAQSFMISADNAHAYHPNYPEKYDPTNHPVPGGGPVIKINARCKYMTDADSAAVFADICERAGVPCQRFVNHSDVAGGSTLGNIFSAQMPVRGVDMGNAIWAMHSCRETGSAVDHAYTIKAFTTFYTL